MLNRSADFLLRYRVNPVLTVAYAPIIEAGAASGGAILPKGMIFATEAVLKGLFLPFNDPSWKGVLMNPLTSASD